MFILHVDDDEDDREMFLAAVEELGFPVMCLQFDNCLKLIDYLNHAEQMPDFLFIDVNMPKMNGLECVEHIRAKHPNEQFKIVIHSTSFNPVQEKSFTEMDIQCLLKSSHFSDLVEEIKTTLSPSLKV